MQHAYFRSLISEFLEQKPETAVTATAGTIEVNLLPR